MLHYRSTRLVAVRSAMQSHRAGVATMLMGDNGAPKAGFLCPAGSLRPAQDDPASLCGPRLTANLKKVGLPGYSTRLLVLQS